MYISNLNCSYVSPQKSNKPLTFMTLSPRVQYEIRSRSFFNFDDSKKASSPTKTRYGANRGQEFNGNGNSFYSNFKNRSQQSNFRKRFDFEDSYSSDDFAMHNDNRDTNIFGELSESSDFSSDAKPKYNDDQNRLKSNQYYSSTFSEEEQEYDSQNHSSSHSKLYEEEEEEYEKQTRERRIEKESEKEEEFHSSSHSKHFEEEEEDKGQINSSSHSKHFDEEEQEIDNQIHSSSHSKHYDNDDEYDGKFHSSSHSKHESSHSRNSRSSSKRKSKKSQLSDEERNAQIQSCSEEGENNFESSNSKKKKKINNKENKDTTTATMMSSSSSKNMSSAKRSHKSSKKSSSCAIEADNSSSAPFANSQKRNSFHEEEETSEHEIEIDDDIEEETSEHELEIDEEESVSNHPDNENDSEYNYIEVVDCGVSPLDKDPNMIDERKVKISNINESESSETGGNRNRKSHSIHSNEENSNSSSSISLGKRKVQPRSVDNKNGSNSDANDFSSDSGKKTETMKKLIESNSELVNAAINNQRAILSTADNEQTRKALEHMQAASELLKKISSELH